MNKLLIFGTGAVADILVREYLNLENNKIIAFDNINEIDYDYILLASGNFDKMYDECIKHNIPKNYRNYTRTARLDKHYCLNKLLFISSYLYSLRPLHATVRNPPYIIARGYKMKTTLVKKSGGSGRLSARDVPEDLYAQAEKDGE
jgi:hypothetical protein